MPLPACGRVKLDGGVDPRVQPDAGDADVGVDGLSLDEHVGLAIERGECHGAEKLLLSR